jgi:hypothetical protein
MVTFYILLSTLWKHIHVSLPLSLKSPWSLSDVCSFYLILQECHPSIFQHPSTFWSKCTTPPHLSFGAPVTMPCFFTWGLSSTQVLLPYTCFIFQISIYNHLATVIGKKARSLEVTSEPSSTVAHNRGWTPLPTWYHSSRQIFPTLGNLVLKESSWQLWDNRRIVLKGITSPGILQLLK